MLVDFDGIFLNTNGRVIMNHGILSFSLKYPTDHVLYLLWRFSTARFGTAQFGSVAFPLQFSTAIEWAGLFTCRYNCAASTVVTSS